MIRGVVNPWMNRPPACKGLFCKKNIEKPQIFTEIDGSLSAASLLAAQERRNSHVSTIALIQDEITCKKHKAAKVVPFTIVATRCNFKSKAAETGSGYENACTTTIPPAQPTSTTQRSVAIHKSNRLQRGDEGGRGEYSATAKLTVYSCSCQPDTFAVKTFCPKDS